MEILNKLLGLCAAMGSAASRQRVNFIPLSVVPLIGVLFLPLLAFSLTLEKGEPQTPQATPLKEIVSETYSGPKHVAIEGKYDGEVAVTHTIRRRRSTTHKTYVAFVDPKSAGAVMVEFDGDDPESMDLNATALTGMLRYMDSDLAEKLPEKVGKAPLSRGFYLKAGEAPLDAGPAPMILLALTLPFGLYVVAWMRSYVIFQRDPDSAAPAAPPAAVELTDVRATGRFTLEGKTSERFLSVPAFLGAFDDGSLGVYANVDASKSNSLYFIPLGKEDRSGYWLIWIGRGTVKNLQRGRQYVGWGSRPALRFTYTSGNTRFAEVAVVSFGSEQERETMLSALQGISA